MVEKKDYVDITPKGVDSDSKGQKGKPFTVFQESEKEHIMENPDGLTKEGIDKKIELWKGSVNRHVELKYRAMLSNCKKIQPSGKDTEGNIILSRDKSGNPTWVEEVVKDHNKKGDK